jgi:hypothetical protein
MSAATEIIVVTTLMSIVIDKIAQRMRSEHVFLFSIRITIVGKYSIFGPPCLTGKARLQEYK